MNLREMNLEEKINKQFRNFSLSTPDPKQNHPWSLDHLHADFIELRTLFWDKSSFLTITDAISFYQDNEIDVELDPSNTLDDLVSSRKTEIDDAWKRKFLRFFSVIEEREIVYEEHYPFLYEKDKIKLKSNLTDEQKLYLYLLIASNLNNFKSLTSVITTEFETISKVALENYMPNFIVEEFGNNSPYKGNTKTKIYKLAEKLKIDPRVNEINQISNTANKEKGLDLIGWASFEDEIASMLIILGQCACGKDWHKKKNETHSYSESYVDFLRLQPIHAMFIPYGLVHYDNQFYESDKTNSKLIFERKRILDMVSNSLSSFKQLNSYSIVDKCIEFDEVEV